jgi:hypothetical protein
MVAIGGVGWSLAPSLKAYVAEADAAYPGRDHASDGSIGDQAHASRESDHNPRDGWVHAVDLDEDLAPGLDLDAFAEKLRARKDRRIAYVIYEGRTFKSYPRNGYPAWAWQPYNGPNAHLHHLHLSILRTPEARNDMTAWGFKTVPAKPKPTKPKPPPLQEDDAMFSYEYDAPGAAPTILVLVTTKGQDRLTGEELLARRRRAEAHLGPIGKDEFDRFRDRYGAVAGL